MPWQDKLNAAILEWLTIYGIVLVSSFAISCISYFYFPSFHTVCNQAYTVTILCIGLAVFILPAAYAILIFLKVMSRFFPSNGA